MTIARRFVPQRDLQRTGFTPSLRHLVAEVPGLHAVAFCDEEGEVIDYHSYLDPYETRVAGAPITGMRVQLERVGCAPCPSASLARSRFLSRSGRAARTRKASRPRWQ